MSASSILSAIAPQFDSNDKRSEHLQLAALRTSECVFGDKYDYAVALRAAHTLALSTRAKSTGGGAGSVSSVKEGDLSISLSGVTGGVNSADLSQTSYGVELDGLIKSNIPGVHVVGSTKFCD